MSDRLDRVIRIVKPNIPVREGTKLHVGYEALRTCNGKTYRQFRSLSGGPVGSKARRFSPSTVWKSAEAEGFARFDGAARSTSARMPTAERHSEDETVHPIKLEEVQNYPSLDTVRELVIADQVTLDLPGIYAWKIEGGAVYVGKYTRKSRPVGEYSKNIRRLLSGEPYRPQNPTGFRRIHTALAHAVREGQKIELHILENCLPEELNARERQWISTVAHGGLNG